MTEPQPKKSDLPVRVASAVVMVVVAGAALWLGGWAWNGFVAAVALGVLWEWWNLVRRFSLGVTGRALWLVGGLIYVGTGSLALRLLRQDSEIGLLILGIMLLGVIFTDIGAYFAGKALGGPKIAKKISPSKTWAGLLGGAIAATFVMAAFNLWLQAAGSEFSAAFVEVLPRSLVLGTCLAIVAQFGDFFESWMKRRAGVKDSGRLIPGHGGLFDRVDGLLAVAFVGGLFFLLPIHSGFVSGL